MLLLLLRLGLCTDAQRLGAASLDLPHLLVLLQAAAAQKHST
jgi:hypothetical protein